MMGAEGLEWALLRVGLLLVVLIFGLAVLDRRLRRRGGRTESGRMRLTAQHALHVVEIGGRRLLVGTGPGGPPAFICELPEPQSRSETARPWARRGAGDGA